MSFSTRLFPLPTGQIRRAFPSRRFVLLLALLLLAQVALGFAPQASAIAPIAFDWQPDGLVNTVALTNDTIYIGGQFNYVGPSTGNFVTLNSATGSLVSDLPRVNGIVNAIASDGIGGWYIGGAFSAVAGLPRENLAHIRANGSLDPNWSPRATLASGGAIRALAVIGTTVYVGGDFTAIAGQNRSALAALNAVSGALHSEWNPNPTHSFSNVVITTLVPVGNTLYVGGAFTNIGGKARGCLATLDAITGQATNWNPNITVTDTGTIVKALAFRGTTVYVGGSFMQVGGQERWDLAAFDTTKNTSNLLNWNAGFVGGDIRSIVVHNTTVYVGGGFYLINGQARNSLAALDAITAAVSPWNANMDEYSVNVLVTDGTTLYAGGGFTQVDNTARLGLAAFDLATNSLKPAFPTTNGQVTAMQVRNGRLYVGGTFTSVGGVQRTNLAAFDRATGEIKDWTPVTSGSSYNTVYALAIDGSTVYVGGDFFELNGQARSYLGALDATTGAVLNWAPYLSGGGYAVVNSIQPIGSSVYVGGRFDNAGHLGIDTIRNGLAAFDRTTGMPTNWNPSTADPTIHPVTISTMAVQGNTLYVGGSFARIGAQVRANAAAINLTSGAVTNWAPQADMTVSTLLVDGAIVYAGGLFSQIGGRSQPLVAALDATNGHATNWRPMLSDENSSTFLPEVSALALDATNVYIGGLFSQLNGRKRVNTAAIDRVTGDAAPWNTTVVGFPRYMAVSGSTLYVIGRFDSVGAIPPRSLATISLAVFTGEATNVRPTRATLHGSLNPDGLATNVTFELTRVSGDYHNPLVIPASPATVSSTVPKLVSAEVTNLAAAVYYYRLVTKNSMGTKYGAELSFDARYQTYGPLIVK